MDIDFSKLSPMMKQYFEIKNSVGDALLLYRLGDFYEMFFDDALTGSRELELTLTGRDCGLDERAPMCGVPYHSVNAYIAKLVSRGYKVAICEQTENPALARGLVRRDVVRVITPGTVTEASMLDESKNNYIACLYACENGIALCFADISTGSVELTESLSGEAAAVTELMRYSPSELIFNAAAGALSEVSRYMQENPAVCSNQLYDSYYELDVAKRQIVLQFDKAAQTRVAALSRGLAVRALGALIKYLRETQKDGVSRLVDVTPYTPEQYMFVSRAAVYNLELFETMRTREKRGSLLWVIDRTSTSMGKRLIRAFLEKPLLDAKLINARLDAVDELVGNSVLLAQTIDALKGIYDLERLMTKIVFKTCTPRELISLAQTSVKLGELKYIAGRYHSAYLKTAEKNLDALSDLKSLIEKTISDQPPALMKDGGYIKPGFSAECDELRGIVTNGKGYLASIEQKLKDETGIKALKVGYNKVFGYYIEVSKSGVDSVPQNFIRKQTLTTGERYITEELKQLEDRIVGANDRLVALERELFDALVAEVSQSLVRVQRSAFAVAQIDVMTSFAETSLRYNYCKPTVSDSDVIEILNGRHAVVERVQDSGLFVPNNCLLDGNRNLVNIITGPNMAGKSTYMRQTAVICLLAQIGCFVPARCATLGIVDKLFTRVGASDDLFSGQSTFMVEMSEVADILANATPRSLLILDEVGRGTSTFDGMSIARAVLEFICTDVRAKTMFATHFHEITEMENNFDCIKNYNIAVKKRGDEITFLRRIVAGCADDSYGIEVAMLAGIPTRVTERAKEILGLLESETGVAEIREARHFSAGNQRAEAVYAAVKSVSIDSLTPIEAMNKLNELIVAANTEDADD